jgi:two-component system sensor histidine kinase YesM
VWMIKAFTNLSIKSKIFISYIVILIITLLMVFVVNSILFVRYITEKTEYSANRTFIQTKSFIEFKTTSAKNLLETFIINETLKEILEKTYADYENNIGLWKIDTQNIEKIFYSGSANPDITRIQLYMSNGPASILQNEKFLNMNDYMNTSWYKKYILKLNRIQWFTNQHFKGDENMSYISALRSIPSNENIRDILGFVKTDIPTSVFQSILDQAVVTPSTTVLLFGENNELLCASGNASDKSEIIQYIMDREFETTSEQLETIKIYSEEVLIGIDEIMNSDWKLVMVVPKKDITNMVNQSKEQLIFVFLIISVLTFPLALLVSISITRPISRLIRNMKEAEKGNFDVDILPSSNNEVGILTRNYNYMLTRISMLLNEKYILGREVKNMELKALQAQINPHFLYNTLEQIYMMAIRYNIPEISDLVLSLSKFYKLSLRKGKDMVTLESELEHVRIYTKIQNIRYNNCVDLEIDVPDNILNVKLPKILLQPIVENAIIHGILETEEEKGTIRITGELINGTVILRVADDGKGMSKDKIQTILTEDTSQDYHGYGIKNIHQRLQLNYGPEYGLSFKSAIGQGTTVILRIPYNSSETD